MSTFTTSGPIARYGVGTRLSEIAIHNGTVYLAGQIPENSKDGDLATQAQEVFDRVEQLLKIAGSSKSHILSCQIFIRDPQEFAEMNSVWDSWVERGHTPPRCTVVGPAIRPMFKIEVLVTAAVANVASPDRQKTN